MKLGEKSDRTWTRARRQPLRLCASGAVGIVVFGAFGYGRAFLEAYLVGVAIYAMAILLVLMLLWLVETFLDGAMPIWRELDDDDDVR